MQEDDDLVSTLRAAGGRQDRRSHRAWLLDPSSDRDRRRPDELARDPAVVVVDTVPEQLDELVRSREPTLQLDGPATGRRVDALVDGSPQCDHRRLPRRPGGGPDSGWLSSNLTLSSY